MLATPCIHPGRPRWALTLLLICVALALPSRAGGAETTKPAAKAPPRALRCSTCAPLNPPATVKPAPAAKGDSESKRARALKRLAGAPSQIHPQGPGQLRQQASMLRRWARYQAIRANPAQGGRTTKPQVLDGWQVRLIDGDTFAYGAERIRIRGIDTPEKSESGGFDASQRLDLLLREGPIVVVPEAVDKYGRVVADVFINGRNVAEVLRSEGHVKPRP